MTYQSVAGAARAHGLAIAGGLHPDDGSTLLLLRPDEPRFWPIFSGSDEYRDGAEDPLDRWSKRVIGQIAQTFGAEALFPSDGPPYPPFLQWALDSGRCWSSPVQLLVHDTAGLFISFRGALRLDQRLALPTPPRRTSPCRQCPAPCLSACPVGAFATGHYDVAGCKAHIATAAGKGCYQGCLVRCACPVSQSYGRVEAQSAFHMRAFHPNDQTSDPDASHQVRLDP